MASFYEMMRQKRQQQMGLQEEPVAPVAPAQPQSIYDRLRQQQGKPLGSSAVAGTNQEQTPVQEPGIGWGEALGGAALNLPGSIYSDVLAPTAQALANPIDTAQAVGGLIADEGISGITFHDWGLHLQELRLRRGIQETTP